MKKTVALLCCALLLALAGPAASPPHALASFTLPDFDLDIPVVPVTTPAPTPNPAIYQTFDPGKLQQPIIPGLIPTAAPAATPKPEATAKQGNPTPRPTARQNSRGNLKSAEITSFGLYFEDFRPRLTEEWYMFTPLDLNVPGRLSYPLVAENAWIVGAVHVTVANGEVTVDYETAPDVKIGREFAALLPNLDALQTLKPELLSGVKLAFGQPLNIQNAFQDDRRVILYLNNTADFRTNAKGVTPFVPEQHQLFMQNLTGLVD